MTNRQERSQFELEEPITGTGITMNQSTFPMSCSGIFKNEEDDETELLSSFASMMVSSIETLGESSLDNSSTQSFSTLIHQSKSIEDVQYQLQRNEYECLGYLQVHVSVSCIQEIPTELSVVSGKLILYVQTAWCSGHAELADAFLHPLILEAIESLFIPVVIIPNQMEGQQSHHLTVTSVGFMDSNHQNLLDPISCRELSIRPIFETAISYVLKRNNQSIPRFLADMMMSHSTDRGFERRSWFAFHDKIPSTDEFQSILGVQRLRCGAFVHQVDNPVVEIVYNFKETCYSALVRQIITMLSSRQIVVYYQSNDERMAARVEINKLSGVGIYNRQIAIIPVSKDSAFEPLIDSNCFAALRQTPLRYVPMTEFQASESNQLLIDGQYENATALLSPKQRKILTAAMSNGFKDNFDVVGFSILDGWKSIMDKKPPYRHSRMNVDTEHDTDLELYCI
jgi:hypothetical protein